LFFKIFEGKYFLVKIATGPVKSNKKALLQVLKFGRDEWTRTIDPPPYKRGQHYTARHSLVITAG